MKVPVTIKTVSEDNNFIYLTFGIILLLLIIALVDQFPQMPGKYFVQAFSVINIIMGVFGFKSSAAWIRTLPGFLGALVSLVLVVLLLDYFQLFYLHLLVLLSFYLWALWLAGKQVFFSGAVDANRVVGAICVYLLLGLIWSLLYLFVVQTTPGAFNGFDKVAWHANFGDVLYYSFVTLTTLGYGDITPVSPIARFLAYMEAVIGVFYMAILVASLVGIGVNNAQKQNR